MRAARLLAEIGDARGRFPTATALACLAGVAPSTRQSGTVNVVSFRWAVDKQLRDAVCDFAGDSRNANPWAADLYDKARARGHDHPHAVRILGRAWIDIIWKCWTTNTPYNPRQHRALQHLLDQSTARVDTGQLPRRSPLRAPAPSGPHDHQHHQFPGFCCRASRRTQQKQGNCRLRRSCTGQPGRAGRRTANSGKLRPLRRGVLRVRAHGG